ncbi:WD40-repeat-containing domain protein [Lipomyces tetrasporus]|uniref:WD40-repeat-containing domain protein n=1 Tax=Lipomyces tetrasporus TaxID=54092 RepID=A0AAD7QKF1_9ASCO|nr:WD40-repeat-containing domain protein [Lipomyces tetrasporus]KAJ8096897.1 WD40-repeat-containing domain protein [Lipomyces tetrasporus]
MPKRRRDEKAQDEKKQRTDTSASGQQICADIPSAKGHGADSQPLTKASSSLAPILRVITGSYEHQLLCLSLTTGISAFSSKKDVGSSDGNFFTPIFHFTPHTASIRTVAHAKRYLVTGGNDEHIRLYDLQKRKEIGTLMFHEGSVTCLEFVSPVVGEDEEKSAGGNGKWLISGGEDGKVLIWRTKDWEVLGDMKGHKGAVNDISVHPSGKIALSVGRDRTLRLWNLMTAKNASVLKLTGGEAIQVAWSTKGDRYAVGWQRKIVIYDMSAKPLSSVELNSPLYRLRYASLKDTHGEQSQVEYLVTSDSTGSITFRDTARASEDDIPIAFELKAHTIRVKDFDFYTRAAPSVLCPDGKDAKTDTATFMSSVSSDGKIVIWNLNAREPIAVYQTNERLNCCTLVAEEVEKYDTRKTVKDAEQSEYESE